MPPRKVRSKPEPEGLLFRESEPPFPGHQQIIKPDPHPSSDEQEPAVNGMADQGAGEDLYDDDSQEEAITGKFTIPETLPSPTSTQRKLEFLLELLENNLIDLSPDYQREVVWTPDRQTGLINSLNENFYVPPIIFNIEERPAAEGSEGTRLVRVCVDGKQRLSSVLRFVQGLIPCKDGDGYRWWWNRVGGRNRNLLDDEFKNRFLAKQLICIEYTNLSDLQQEDLFGRVQKGMALTEAEMLKAEKGPWQDLALDCEDDFKGVIALSQNRRASGFRNLLTVMAQITELRTVDTKMDRRAADTPALQASAASLKKFVKVEKDKCTATAINLIAWVFQLWEKIRQKNLEIFQNNNYKAARNFAPIEFLAVGVMLFKYGNYRTLTMLRGDIIALRLWLRERNHDLRTNSKCWRDCWEFIEHLEGLRGESGPWTNHGIDPVLKGDGAPNRPTNRAGASTSRKRGNGKEPWEGVMPDAILARAEQKLGSTSQNNTPRKIVSLKVKVRLPGNGIGAAQPEDPTPPTRGKKRGPEVYNITSASLPNAPSAVPRISKTKSILPHHPPPPKWPFFSTVQRPPPSPSVSSSNDSDDESSRLTHLRQAHQAPKITSSGSALTTTPAVKRKRLSVKTVDGASQLLSKRKKRALSE